MSDLNVKARDDFLPTMIQLSANLSFLFTERPFMDRFAAAADAGFKAVEYMFPYEFDADEIRDRLAQHGLQQVLFNLPAGDWSAGERGLACHPGREDEFQRGVLHALTLAKKLNVRHLNCLSGLKPDSASEAECARSLQSNLRWAADRAGELGVNILIEPINSRIDMPGFWLDTPQKAMAMLDALDHPNLFLQYDVYHAHVMGGSVVSELSTLLPRVAHIQIADHPGRHQPGTGDIPYPAVFSLLAEANYTGWVGCEYRPSGHTKDSFVWAASLPGRRSWP